MEIKTEIAGELFVFLTVIFPGGGYFTTLEASKLIEFGMSYTKNQRKDGDWGGDMRFSGGYLNM